MNKDLLNELKEKLEKQKANIEKELGKFAKKDDKLEGDWDTIFPRRNSDSSGSSLEMAADEVEEYSTLLPIEHSLETQLRDINSSLEKIEKGNYGKCGNCGVEINIERLKVYPEAAFCINCEK